MKRYDEIRIESKERKEEKRRGTSLISVMVKREAFPPFLFALVGDKEEGERRAPEAKS